VGTRIDLDGVGKRYRIGETVVDALVDVDLHVDETSLLVILGASGCGKTTLLNMIGLLDTPTAGTVRLAGRDVTNASRKARYELRRTTLSFIFQSFNLFPALTALENVQFGAQGECDCKWCATSGSSTKGPSPHVGRRRAAYRGTCPRAIRRLGSHGWRFGCSSSTARRSVSAR
jgi:predicted ABC-type transport system involved in lysophospholipase L1 biosynthesis ATPase subunit